MVEQDQRDPGVIGPLEDLQRLLATLGGAGLVAETADGFFEDATLGRIVVDDQDELGHVAGTRHNRLLNAAAGPIQHRTTGHA